MCVWQCPGTTGTEHLWRSEENFGELIISPPPHTHHLTLALLPLSRSDRSIMILNVSSYFRSPTSYSFPHFRSFWKHSQTHSEACLTAPPPNKVDKILHHSGTAGSGARGHWQLLRGGWGPRSSCLYKKRSYPQHHRPSPRMCLFTLTKNPWWDIPRNFI